jgi:hypothetical protein
MTMSVEPSSFPPSPSASADVLVATHAPTAPAPVTATRGERITCAVLAVVAFSVLGVALWLNPSPEGHGTHQALGMAPCGWMVAFGMPCPSCGMTTAFAHAAHGSLLASVRVQPMGFILALGTAATALVGTYVAMTGSRLGHVLGDRLTPRFLLALGIFALLSWGWKIAVVRGFLPVSIGTP